MRIPSPTVTILGLLLTVSAAPAERHGGFRETDVVGAARWYVHIDLEQLKTTQVGKDLQGQLDEKAMAGIRVLERLVGVNPLEDLDAITLSGTDVEPHRAVAAIRGVFDRAHLIDLTRLAKGPESIEHGGHTIYSWLDPKTPGGRVYASFPDGDTIYLGPDRELMEAALARRDSGSGSGGVASEADQRAIVNVWADLTLLEGIEIESAFIRRVGKVHLSAGERDGKLYGRIVVETGDDKTSRLLGRMFSGAVALAEAAEHIPDGTSDSVVTEASGRRLAIDVEIALESLDDLVKSVVELQRGL